MPHFQLLQAGLWNVSPGPDGFTGFFIQGFLGAFAGDGVWFVPGMCLQYPWSEF